ncbi:MarR family transcriptional regulator [Mammaliicoccus sciuri]|uniref:MarR family winged helix-turn-helix transcriptional regulator n=1 Tax=Mammaliicoccus sciuri TaxID=1296 RepID=UPI0019D3BA50|nr:MarR family transcriptional regulator [Mammaliicoccus sciuri]MCJ0933696.1 winged helix DNA-binding protein [Mammaliicoccus sciuri]MEB8072229.1 winged helix DNA-binding protein [Mammaliicoccus sciuri]QSN67016.1 MarR family transcriptional regulator [Mammaliicoccus sciuri]UIU21737.1 winged helix DNA-binding protein [Mammaliicoccus sciuri]UIU24637.1 winged helix DNA-binding protein [Mammaliicoccus sciuri]
MNIENCVNYLLSTSQNKVFKHFKTLLSPYNITPSEYGVLNCIINSNLNTPKLISNTLKLEAPTLSGILYNMSKKDLVFRETDTDNRRTVIIGTTEKAEKIWPTLEKLADELNNICFSNLTDEETKILKSTLMKINNTNFKNVI